MPGGLFGKRERFPCHPSKPLAQGVVPAFHVGGLPRLLADTLMGLAGKDAGIRPPKVAERPASPIGPGDPVPECPAGLFAAVTVDKGDDLPGPAA